MPIDRPVVRGTTGVAPIAVALACGVAAAPAAAALEPYWFGASQTVVAQTNVYRAPAGEPESRDLVSQTSLAAGIDQPFRRARLSSSGELRAQRYKNNTNLDNDGGTFRFRLEGETVGRLSGHVDYAFGRTLAAFDANAEPNLRVRNVETSQQGSALVQLGLASLLSTQLTALHRVLAYSEPAYATLQHRQDQLGWGLQWRPSDLLNGGLSLRRTLGTYPQGVRIGPDAYAEDSFERHDGDLTLTWRASGASSLQARISASRQRYRQATQRDFDGVTGSFRWSWQPTGKLHVDTSVLRDTGSETTFYRLGDRGASAVGDYSRLSDSVAVELTFEPTAKLRLSASLQGTQRRLVNALVVPNLLSASEQGTDQLAVATLGARYLAARSIGLGCDLRHEHRRAYTSLSYPYDATVGSCHVQLTLR
jgi:hypothetical protein